MRLIQTFLGKFASLGIKEASRFNCICDEIDRVLGVSIDRKVIKVEGNRISVQGNPLVKSELIAKWSQIERSLTEKTGVVYTMR